MTDKMITVKESRRNTILTLGGLTLINALVLGMGMGVSPNKIFDVQPWMFIVVDIAIMFVVMFAITIGWLD